MPKTTTDDRIDRGGRPGMRPDGSTSLDLDKVKRNLRLAWYAGHGMTPTEIAEIEDMPRSTASEAIAAGKAFLAARDSGLLSCQMGGA